MDTLQKIISYEKEAQKIYSEAIAYRDGMPELIKKEIRKLKEETDARAEKRLADAAHSEERYLQESTAEIEEKTKEDKKRLDEICEKNKEKWVAHIFDILTGFDEPKTAEKD